MSKKGIFRTQFCFGLVFSLSGHMLWVVFVAPVVKTPVLKPIQSGSVFLGAILKESDLLSVAGAKGQAGRISDMHDFSRDAYFEKSAFVVHKPMAKLDGVFLVEKRTALSEMKPILSKRSKDIAFGLSDISGFIYGEDFSDLKKIASREELSSYMDFRILVNAKGEVRSIEKIIGSGDPAIDLYVMAKLRRAIFKVFLIEPDVWVNVRFRIKE